jgi:hypothetical protein
LQESLGHDQWRFGTVLYLIVSTNQVRERSSGSVQYEESGLPSPDLLVEGLEPGAAYIATVTSINKKVRYL